MLVLCHESVQNIYTTGFLHGIGQVDVKVYSHIKTIQSTWLRQVQVSYTNAVSALSREEDHFNNQNNKDNNRLFSILMLIPKIRLKKNKQKTKKKKKTLLR